VSSTAGLGVGLEWLPGSPHYCSFAAEFLSSTGGSLQHVDPFAVGLSAAAASSWTAVSQQVSPPAPAVTEIPFVVAAAAAAVVVAAAAAVAVVVAAAAAVFAAVAAAAVAGSVGAAAAAVGSVGAAAAAAAAAGAAFAVGGSASSEGP